MAALSSSQQSLSVTCYGIVLSVCAAGVNQDFVEGVDQQRTHAERFSFRSMDFGKCGSLSLYP